jgi:hypothetical protein
MEDLHYYDLPGLIKLCVMGDIDMHEPLEISNRLKNQKIEISILKHFLILCERDSKSLIHILSLIRSRIKEYLLGLLSENHYVKNYIQNVIDEWGYEIIPEELFMDGLNKMDYVDGDDIIPYEQLLEEKRISEETSQKLKMIEDGIKERQESYIPVTREYAEQIQDRIKDLHTQCKTCMDSAKKQSGGAMEKLKLIEPKHRDILLDLSIKPKSMYIEYLSLVSKEESSVLSSFMSDLQNVNIPDNIHTIFLNYVITINMLKKEINYMSNSFKQLIVDTQPRLQLLNKFTDGSDELHMLVIDEDKGKQVEEPSSGFGFSFF